MDEPVLEAELVEQWPGKQNQSKSSLNAALGGTVAIVLVFLLLSRTIGAPLEDTAIEESMEGYTPIAERYLEDYYTEGENSYILENGTMTGPDGASLWLGTHYFVDFELPLRKAEPHLMAK